MPTAHNHSPHPHPSQPLAVRLVANPPRLLHTGYPSKTHPAATQHAATPPAAATQPATMPTTMPAGAGVAAASPFEWACSAGWTSGFYPGLLWQLANTTSNTTTRALFRAKAERWTAGREALKTQTTTHDVGFEIFGSFGNGLQLGADNATYVSVADDITLYYSVWRDSHVRTCTHMYSHVH